MKKRYEELEIELFAFTADDVITLSGEVDGDETKYPIPEGWGGVN